jgi:hypothetical protein
MKWLLYLTLSVSVAVVLLINSGSAEEKAATDPNYEKMLYDLGAFPVAKLTQPYWTNGNPGKVYSKGERVDVDGWLPSQRAPDYLTDAEKVQYGIPTKPLSYEQYMAMLDIDTYKRTHDPMLFLVMRFALESMVMKGVPVRKEDVIHVYEAKVGLEPFAVPLLIGQLSGADAMRLISAYGDEKLFAAFPTPQPEDKTYIAFLVEQANTAKWPIRCRQDAYKLLYAMNENAYRKPYKEFLLSHVRTAKDWWDRAGLYDGLIQLNDEESLKAVGEGLAHDPITECRESILYHLKEHGEVVSAIDAILVVANGQDEKHHAVAPGRSWRQWTNRLNEYLKWAKSQKDLDAATMRKVDQAIEKLRDQNLN